MHNAAFRAAGLDWTYELLDVPAESLRVALDQVRGKDSAGANVTIPHKLAVMSISTGSTLRRCACTP